MLMGSGFPDELVSALCMRNATPCKNEKTQVLASVRNRLAFPREAAQMRQLFG